tara:strand:- start:137 stop:427 length:291 start_codon:yes stop_codon:yes gene_type:complete
MTNVYNTLISPVITEKATKISENNQYVFKVSLSSNKKSIKEAIEKLFKVKVKSINTTKVKGKTKIFKGTKGKRADYKKAIVSLKDGENLDYSGGVN